MTALADERTPLHDALDHIMRVARQGVTPTRRLDWIALRAKYALEGKQWSGDVREEPRDSVAKLRKDLQQALDRNEALEKAHERSHAEVLRLAELLRAKGWDGAAPMHLNKESR